MSLITPSPRLLLLLALCWMLACTPMHSELAPQQIDAAPFEARGKFRKQYVLVPGDTIEVSVWRVPEVSRTVVVRPDGKISLPTLSGVQAAGSTLEDLEQHLAELFSARLKDPQVTVIATTVRQRMVYVVGDVAHPTSVPLQQVATPMQAVAAAGGFLRSGARDDVSIIRLGEDGVLRAVPVAVAGDAQPDAYLALSSSVLQEDDIIFVPETKRSEAMRFIDDFIARPLSSISALTNVYLSYKVVTSNNL